MTALERPLWVCIACLRRYAPSERMCESCNVAMVPLSHDEVRQEVARAAEARLSRRVYLEYAVPTVVTSVTLVPVYMLVRLGIIPVWWLLGSLLALAVGVRSWRSRASGLRIMAERRRRISAELGYDVQIPDDANAPKMIGGMLDPAAVPDREVRAGTLRDPMLLAGEALLRWLGATAQHGGG